MAREAKVIITSENKAGPGIQSAVRDILGLDDAAKKIGNTLATAFTVTAIVEAGKKAVEFGMDCVKAFGDVERSMIQLNTALGGNEASFSRMTGLIDEMAGKTLASKDEIEKLVAELASLGKSDADIEKITRASVALSNVTGKDLNSSMLLINATFEGSSGKLSKLIPEVGDLTKAQLEAGGAVDLLNQKFGAISDAMGQGISQKFHNLSLSFYDFKEAIGADLAPLFSPMIDWIGKIISQWTASIDEHRKYRQAIADGNADDAAAANAAIDIMSLRGSATRVEGNIVSARSRRDSISEMGGDTSTVDKTLDSYYKQLADIYQKINDNTKIISDIQAKTAAAAPARTSGGSGASSPVISPINSGDVNITRDQVALITNAMLDPSVLALKEFYGNPANFIGVTTATSTYDAGPAQEYANSQRYHSAPNESAGGYQGAVISDPITELGKIFEGMRSGAAVGSSLGGGIVGGSVGAAGGGLDAIGGIFSELWKSVGPLISSFSSVQAILNPLQTIFSSMMEVVGPLVNEALAPLVGILKIVGHALGDILAPIIKGIGSVIEFVAKGILWVWNGIVDAINWALGWLGVNLNHASFDDAKESGSDTTSDSTTTTSAGASYTGSQSITFNFYNQGNVVGSGGMTELAMIINDLITKQARYA